MNIKSSTFFRSYGFSILLIVSIGIGSLLGIVLKKEAVHFKPFGDVFLNLLFTAIVPLVFFSIASAVAGMSNVRRLGKILSSMMLVFILTGIAASTIMAIAVQFYPPAAGITLDLNIPASPEQFKTSEQIVKAFAAPDFLDILSKKNMLALIIFSILIGLATSSIGEKGTVFSTFLASANEVMMKVIHYIMYYAPVGLCAYFAYFIGLFHMDFSGAQTLLTAIGIAILCGTVVSGIPGGGTIGELLIISLYGFPPEVFPIITMIGTLVDPPATMVNAIGDNVASMMVARILGGRNWMPESQLIHD